MSVKCDVPCVTKAGLLIKKYMQVCVPAEWSDAEVTSFAEGENPSGTECGWVIRRDGDELLRGDPERQPCDERAGYVHVMLDCDERRVFR
mgnify:CR=1 FL=1